jgi:hypothetical protein
MVLVLASRQPISGRTTKGNRPTKLVYTSMTAAPRCSSSIQIHCFRVIMSSTYILHIDDINGSDESMYFKTIIVTFLLHALFRASLGTKRNSLYMLLLKPCSTEGRQRNLGLIICRMHTSAIVRKSDRYVLLGSLALGLRLSKLSPTFHF